MRSRALPVFGLTLLVLSTGGCNLFAARYYNARGFGYYNRGDYDHAIADHNQAIRLKPRLALAFNNRGMVFLHKRDYDTAITDFNQALTLTPNDAIAHSNRAIAYYRKRDYDQAIRDGDFAI